MSVSCNDHAIICYFYLHVYNNVEEDMISKCEGDIRRGEEEALCRIRGIRYMHFKHLTA